MQIRSYTKHGNSAGKQPWPYTQKGFLATAHIFKKTTTTKQKPTGSGARMRDKKRREEGKGDDGRDKRERARGKSIP